LCNRWWEAGVLKGEGGFAPETKKAPKGLICLKKRDLAKLHHHLDFR
jgi:hypothetical protein